MMKVFRKRFKITVLSVFVLSLMPVLGAAQEAGSAEDEFVNWGYVSVSPNFTVGKDSGFVVFQIKNNATRSIRTIHAWIYEVLEDDQGAATFRLVNNPNIGGLLFKQKFHSPGAVADWRFSLVAANRAAGGDPKFTLRVSHRGIYFVSIEPPVSGPAAQ